MKFKARASWSYRATGRCEPGSGERRGELGEDLGSPQGQSVLFTAEPSLQPSCCFSRLVARFSLESGLFSRMQRSVPMQRQNPCPSKGAGMGCLILIFLKFLI